MTAFPLDGLFFMSSHDPQKHPRYLPDFVYYISSLSGSLILCQVRVSLSWNQNCSYSMEVTEALCACHCKGQLTSISVACPGDWYKICVLFMSCIKTSKNRYLTDKSSRGSCCKSEHILTGNI